MQPKDVLQYFHSAVTHLHTGRMDTDNVQHSHTDHHFMTKCSILLNSSNRNALYFKMCSYRFKIRMWGQAAMMYDTVKCLVSVCECSLLSVVFACFSNLQSQHVCPFINKHQIIQLDDHRNWLQ